MSPHPPPATAPADRWRWGIVWLLFLATLINYTDRLALNNTGRYLLPEFVPDRVAGDPLGGVGGAAAVAAEADLISQQRNGMYAEIQFAFGVTFGLFQVVAGFLIDRFSIRWLYLGAIVVWSAAGVLTGFVPAGAVGALLACRIALGVGEAFNWPCAVACIRRVIPRESRGLANGIFHSGASIGAVATPLLVLLLVNELALGWRSLFVVVGGLGAVWGVLWLLNTRGDRAAAIDAPPAEDPGSDSGINSLPAAAAFGMRQFWICLATGVFVNVCWHFYNQWLPRYFTEDLKLTARGEQWVLAGFFVAADLGSMFSGWLTRRLVRAGATVERSRKLVMTGLALTVCAATAPAALLPGDLLWAKFALFFVVGAGAIGGFAIFFALAQDIIPRHTAQLLGICGCVSWLSISGLNFAVGRFKLAGPGKYDELFIAVGCVPLLAAAAGWLWPEPKGRK